MNEDKQRIAIAGACGWSGFKTVPTLNGKILAGDHPSLSDWERNYPLDGAVYGAPIPDYLNDLNAMHEAEEIILKQGLQDRWLDTLVEVVVGSNVHWSDYHCFPQVNRAKAPQRAEAFLKTLNLWTP